MVIQRILCPIDFSDGSRHALEHAAAFANWYEARITVLHVYTEPRPFVPASGLAGNVALPPRVRPEEVLEEVRRFGQIPGARDGGPEFVIKEGRPATEIVRYAEAISAGLLVMGTHGSGGFERLFLGSVTEKVLRTTQCPVLTVPPGIREAPRDPLVYKNILCPLDFSDASIRALEHALSLAREADAHLILLHVLEDFIDHPYIGQMAHLNLSEVRRHLEEDARARIRAAIPDAARLWCTPEERLAAGKAYREILRTAVDIRADLIVMGVHGGSAVNRWLFGSTTHHIVRGAACPVLTLRA